MTKGIDSPATPSGSEPNSVMRLMTEMMRLPFTAFVYSFEIFVRTMQGMQRMADQGFATLAGDIAQSSNDRGAGNESTIAGMGADRNQQTTHEEENVMWDDQDLSGDDLKYVSYSILFTKRDFEATLEEQKQDLVNYPTNGGSYGGLKIAHFMKKVGEGKIKRPEEWKEPGNSYPPGASGDYFTEIPKDDERYITFIYKVDRRLDRQDADRDKQKLEALRGIRSSIDKVGAKIA
jgi:hypothetical protein